MSGTLGLHSETWRTVPSDSSVLIFASTHLLARPVGHDSGIIIMDFPMDMTKFQEVINQAVHQAMINLSNGLSNTVHSVVRGTIASNLSHQYNHNASQPMVFQHPASAQICGCQYYASAPQPMGC